MRPLLAAGVAIAAFAVTSPASGGPAPVDPPPATPVSTHIHSAGGRTDQDFWGQATWLNPLSGLNLDRTSAGS